MSKRTILSSLVLATLAFSQAAFANEPPVVQLVSATNWVNDEITITYIVHDADDDVDGNLTYSLFFYPDSRLSTVADVLTFATRFADQLDLDPEIGTGDFAESTGPANRQDYTWGDPGVSLRNQGGWAGAHQVFPGQYYVYLLADDGTNEPVMTVSDFALTVDHTATAINEITWGMVKTSR